MTAKELGEGILGLVAMAVIAVWYFGSDDTQAEAPTVIEQELTNEQLMEIQLDKAHKQYAQAVQQKNDHHDRWLGSTHLPRVGNIRADDYLLCKREGWYRDTDEHDFCAWHASIGTWYR